MQCPEFMAYFKTYYATPERTRKWAMCYRQFDHANTDTNMLCESFQNKLKTFYLDRRPNKRLDDLVNLVLAIEEDGYWRDTIFNLNHVITNQPKQNVIVD